MALALEVDTKELLRNRLLRHRGRENAVTAMELARQFGYRDDRKIRIMIRDLISEGLPVAAATESPAGYFVIASILERDVYANTIRSRLKEDALRRRDFLRAAALYSEQAGQGRLI